MASERQVAANRRNAARSTGPRTAAGKLRSRQNAYRHGLTAETVITSLEHSADYQAFETGLFDDYAPHGAVEHELVARLASLLWRLRRAARIETELFEIQGGVLQQRQRDQLDHEAGNPELKVFYKLLQEPDPAQTADKTAGSASLLDATPHPAPEHSRTTDMATAYLRLSRNNPSAVKRLTRYETALWRQVAQTLLVLETAGNSWRQVSKVLTR